MPPGKWEAARPIRPSGNLISSPQFKHLRPFNVSYDKEENINMNFIMGWEYGRVWFEEQKVWTNLNYGQKQTIGAGSPEILHRKVVQKHVRAKKTGQPGSSEQLQKKVVLKNK